jgi:DNA-nicking Smr family endonuclease
MSKLFPPDDDDLIFFRAAMKDVKPLKRLPVVKTRVKKTSRLSQGKAVPVCKKVVKFDKDLIFSLSDPLEQNVTAEDKLFFKRQGPQIKVIKKLVRGEMAYSACLDLHGMTVTQARKAVMKFLLLSHESGFRCVQIIHGKGQFNSTLKNHVNYWLPQIPLVLAFSSAQARDGGRGAVYVLLAKPPFLKNIIFNHEL